MNKTQRSNITNFLNWNDKNSSIDETYSSHDLVALFIYTLNCDVLYIYNWNDLLEYSEESLIEQMDQDTTTAYNLMDIPNQTEQQFEFIINNLSK